MYALFQKMLNVSSEHSFTLLEASPIQISPFLFEDYLQIVNTDFLKPGIKKKLSEDEASELQNFNTESLDGLAFSK